MTDQSLTPTPNTYARAKRATSAASVATRHRRRMLDITPLLRGRIKIVANRQGSPMMQLLGRCWNESSGAGTQP